MNCHASVRSRGECACLSGLVCSRCNGGKPTSLPPDVHIFTFYIFTTTPHRKCGTQSACRHRSKRFKRLKRRIKHEGSAVGALGLLASPPRKVAHGHP